MSNNDSQLYFYVADILDIHDGLGHTLSAPKEHALVFQASARQAQGIFFKHGYILDSEEGLFENDGRRFVSERFDTTDGSNSTEDDVPDRVGILMKNYPLLRVYADARFGQLHVQRTIVPKKGGGLRGARRLKSRRAKKSRRNTHRNTRRSRH